MSHHPPVRLLDKVRQRIRLKGYSIRTERSYSQWIKRFILFHNKRHPRDMGKMEIEAFLSDLAMNQIVVRDGKGKKDRITMLPKRIRKSLQDHLSYVHRLHQKDLRDGYGRVYLPYALARKYRNADKSWGWQYVFPAKTISVAPRSGEKRRHHIHETVIRKAIKTAAQTAGIVKSRSHATRCGTALRRIC